MHLLARHPWVARAVLRYHHEQGLTAHRWTIEEIFTPDPLET
ncbi:hypothetical protein [Streptomyces sp. NEAU-YJ-81]|nr:hypothetical protein [Streptomyces sp. NEAU-YJ-81]